MRRRRGARVLAIAGCAALGTCVLSEWRGVAWWSAVRGIGGGPHQAFFVFARGELRAGTRGTAGFFTRGIPAAGWQVRSPGRIVLNPAGRVWIPWRYEEGQTVSYILPVTPLAGAAGAAGAAGMLRRRRPAWECASCGYDLRGAGARCPECGTERPSR